EVTINHDRMGSVELSRPATLHSPTQQRPAVLVELQHPRIPVAIRNVNVAISVPGNIGGLIEMQYIISRNPHSPQRKQHAPFRAKLQNHMRTDIGGPDIVLGIDATHAFPPYVRLPHYLAFTSPRDATRESLPRDPSMKLIVLAPAHSSTASLIYALTVSGRYVKLRYKPPCMENDPNNANAPATKA